MGTIFLIKILNRGCVEKNKCAGARETEDGHEIAVISSSDKVTQNTPIHFSLKP